MSFFCDSDIQINSSSYSSQIAYLNFQIIVLTVFQSISLICVIYFIVRLNKLLLHFPANLHYEASEKCESSDVNIYCKFTMICIIQKCKLSIDLKVKTFQNDESNDGSIELPTCHLICQNASEYRFPLVVEYQKVNDKNQYKYQMKTEIEISYSIMEAIQLNPVCLEIECKNKSLFTKITRKD